MRIDSVYKSSYNSLPPNLKNNTNFRGLLYEDDFMEGSIFSLRDKQEKYQTNGMSSNDFADYWASQKTVGKPVSDADMGSWKIKGFNELGNDTYKGGMQEAINYINKFKENGFRKFIILSPELEHKIIERCKKAGMDYDSFFVPIAPELPQELKTDIMEKISINRLVDSIVDLRKGKVFIGCENGTLRTSRMLTVFKTLDPSSKLRLPDEILSKSTFGNFQFVEWIYRAMNDAHKAALGHTKEFTDNLLRDLSNIAGHKF